MEKEVDNVAGFLMSVLSAAFAAFSLGYIAHYDFDLSPQGFAPLPWSAPALLSRWWL
jgi:hypothetical protein